MQSYPHRRKFTSGQWFASGVAASRAYWVEEVERQKDRAVRKAILWMLFGQALALLAIWLWGHF